MMTLPWFYGLDSLIRYTYMLCMCNQPYLPLCVHVCTQSWNEIESPAVCKSNR